MSPRPLQGLPAATSVVAGEQHSCARLADGSVRCWGQNYFGQLGAPDIWTPEVPVTIAGLSNVTSIAAGANHACAQRDDNTVRCWGWNDNGQLGDPTITEWQSFSPLLVPW